METLLITGAGPNGVTGRAVKEFFEGKYNMLTPSSSELDLTDDAVVSDYFSRHAVDYVIHCATFRPTTAGHFVDEELESNLRMYFALSAQSSKFKKMIYFGSGAEFDKSKPIVNATEDDFGRSIPKNKYGLGKYIMNNDARKSENIYNLRLFGTINKYEKFTKNIVSNICVKAMTGLPIHLRQDCRYSFIDIDDILPIIESCLSKDLLFHDYNLTMDDTCLLSDLAKIAMKLAGRNESVSFDKEGLNLEYTGANRRMKNTFDVRLSSIESSVERVYKYYESLKDSIDISEIDARWK